MEMPSEIEEVASPTHNIQLTKTESPKVVNVMFVRDNEAMDKDVIVNIRTQNPHQPRAVIEEGSLTSNSVDSKNNSSNSKDDSNAVGRAAMVTFVPQFVLNEINAEFIFVVDRSGSMSGTKIEQTKNALELFLRALPASCYFNIIGFGSSFEKLFEEGSQPYTEDNVYEAERHIKKLRADLGGTELMYPLRSIYSDSKHSNDTQKKKRNYNRSKEPRRYESQVPSNYARQIIVLTDGEVSNTDEVIKIVVENHKKHYDWRLFTIGVGSSVSRALVEGMARGGRGTVQIITDNERVEPKVMATLKQALQPALTNVRVDWGVREESEVPATNDTSNSSTATTTKTGSLVGHRLNEKKPTTAVRDELVYQAPFNVPPIYSGKRFIVYAFLHPNAIPEKITVKADSPDGPLDLVLQVEKTFGSTVQRLAARSLIRDLEEGTSHLHKQKRRPAEARVKQEIVDLGVKYNLVSKHTSFIAVEDRSEERQRRNWMFPPTQQLLSLATPLNFYVSTLCAIPTNAPPGSHGSGTLSKKRSRARSRSRSPQPTYMESLCLPECDEEDDDEECCDEGDENESLDESMVISARQERMSLSESCKKKKRKASVVGVPSAETTARASLMSLLKLQKIDGSFEAKQPLANAVRLTMSELLQIPPDLPLNGAQAKIWTTALVIAFIMKTFASLKAEWELVADKSKNWIDKQLKTAGIYNSATCSSTTLITRAQSLVRL
eukprot:TRINITY_DN3828_c0_g1_i1.p1 TRINITY_DN3828_c0_g1~~TRINITY_DN3828_c0_g1_i1.p1  ORF type:complete len:722 (+),score=174.56 TRINITY_DN3828_c0_g1_i1:35-2200(+)